MVPETSDSQSAILLAENLCKSYGPRLALRELSFTLRVGHVLGFLGPNGAGKTTAIRVLTTILEPDAGHFTVNGISSKNPEKIRRLIGVLPESMGFPKQMTGLEFLTFFGELYGQQLRSARKKAWELLENVGLRQRARSFVGSYSRGMRQRLGIARALINDPAVLFLDEPTLGLDPRGQQELLELVRQIAQERRVGIVMCSHALSEIEVVCDDVVILNTGRVVAQGTVTSVIENTRKQIRSANDVKIRTARASIVAARQVLAALPNVSQVRQSDETPDCLYVQFSEPVMHGPQQFDYNKLLEALIRSDIPIHGFETGRTHLRDVFLHLTKETTKQ